MAAEDSSQPLYFSSDFSQDQLLVYEVSEDLLKDLLKTGQYVFVCRIISFATIKIMGSC